MAEQNERMVHDLEAMDRSVRQPKIIYAGDVYNGQPYLVVTEDDIALVGDKNTVFSASPSLGVLLGGRVSLSCLPDQLSFGGGYWRLDPRHLSTVPSTTPTPLPLLVKSVPLLLKAKKDIQGALSGMEALSDLVKF